MTRARSGGWGRPRWDRWPPPARPRRGRASRSRRMDRRGRCRPPRPALHRTAVRAPAHPEPHASWSRPQRGRAAPPPPRASRAGRPPGVGARSRRFPLHTVRILGAFQPMRKGSRRDRRRYRRGGRPSYSATLDRDLAPAAPPSSWRFPGACSGLCIRTKCCASGTPVARQMQDRCGQIAAASAPAGTRPQVGVDADPVDASRVKGERHGRQPTDGLRPRQRAPAGPNRDDRTITIMYGGLLVRAVAQPSGPGIPLIARAAHDGPRRPLAPAAACAL